MLQISHLFFSYPDSTVAMFEDFSLALQDTWIVVAGSNGTGKSTLLHLIAGLFPPDSRNIHVSGEPCYCPQETAEVPDGIYATFWRDNESRRFFSRLHVTEEMLARYDTLSGGEKKAHPDCDRACRTAHRPSAR